MSGSRKIWGEMSMIWIPPDRAPNPHFLLERRFRGPKTPSPLSPSQDPEKGSFRQKIPIFLVFPCRKKGFFDQIRVHAKGVALAKRRMSAFLGWVPSRKALS